jgi:hypothetical protein
MGYERMLRRVGLLTVAAVSIAAMAAGSGAAARSNSSECGPRGGTVLTNGRIRLYRTTEVRSGEDRQALYGCLKGSRINRRIGPLRRQTWAASVRAPFAISGAWASAIEERQVGQDTVRIYAAMRDIRSGIARYCSVGAGDRPGQWPTVRSLVMSMNGWVAWAAIVSTGSSSPPRAVEIDACDSGGVRVLDSGSDIESSSLTIHGSTVSWMKAGEQHSAKLR